MKVILSALFLFFSALTFPQGSRGDIYSAFVLYPKRLALEQDLKNRVIAQTFALPLDSNSESRYESACWSVAQFLFRNAAVEAGFNKLFLAYDSLQFDTQHALLEAVYAVYPSAFAVQVNQVIAKETEPKLFSICAAYLYRYNSLPGNSHRLVALLGKNFPAYDTVAVLQELHRYLTVSNNRRKQSIPDLAALFLHRQASNQKTIYSLQRWNRNYPGLAIVQLADGHFVKDAKGRLQVFEQLARSGADLPYFITNGSTPQGIFSIQGTAVSHSLYIGPTPNIQLLMPFEENWGKFFHSEWDGSQDSLQAYQQLLPASWRHYEPMWEVWSAGHIGRTEIIAHGTTIDPEYYKDKPFYPLTPTQGCLCAKELWNTTSGHLLVSEQFNLATAYQSGSGDGYLYVINIDDQAKAVSRGEVERWVSVYEKRRRK